MTIQRCNKCEHYSCGFGRIPYRICKKAAKPIDKIGGYKTSPKWCPLRKETENMTPTEKLIAEARELLTKWNDTSYSFFSFVGDARYLILALCDALEEAQNDQRWTETEYSPPDDIGQSVWLYSQDGEIVHGEYLGEGWYNLPRGAVHGTYFSHWMPDAKPQPPKGED